MTLKEKNLEKIIELKQTISFLYEKEGRTIFYIARLLNVDRSTLSKQVRAWEMVKANSRHINPSTQKFINKHSEYIISQLRQDVAISKIAVDLGISKDKLYYIIKNDSKLSKEKEIADNKKKNKKIEKSRENNYFEDLPNEEWRNILGYDNYFISNMGRCKKYLSTYDCYTLISSTPNSRNGRPYIGIINNEGITKNLALARVVAHAFCEGYSEENNTVDHKDGNITNNCAENLQWVSQTENNRRAFKNGRKSSVAYSKNGKFKKIILDGKYEFKTITSLAKFLNISQTQTHRYISGECKTEHNIELIY